MNDDLQISIICSFIKDVKLYNLAEELIQRLELDRKEHSRRAKIVSVNIQRAKQPPFSRTVSLREYNKLTLKEDIDKQVVSKLPINQDGSLSHEIKSMSLVASRFVVTARFA